MEAAAVAFCKADPASAMRIFNVVNDGRLTSH
jgi:hypothetical protein